MNAVRSLVEVRVPDMGNFKDVAVIDVLVKPGDTVAIDSPLVTLESDKATMDVPSTAVGVVEKIHTNKGGKVNTGDLIATVADGTCGSVAATRARYGDFSLVTSGDIVSGRTITSFNMNRDTRPLVQSPRRLRPSGRAPPRRGLLRPPPSRPRCAAT